MKGKLFLFIQTQFFQKNPGCKLRPGSKYQYRSATPARRTVIFSVKDNQKNVKKKIGGRPQKNTMQNK
jgi:hypothetical protein